MGPHKSKILKMKKQSINCLSMSSLRMQLSQENIKANCQINLEGCVATPLWFAVSCEDICLAELFLSAGANVNTPCGGLLSTPLHVAAYKHNVKLVKLLLDCGANPNVLDKWNYTPLMYVSIHYDPNVVIELFSLLISYGCDVNFGATMNIDGTVEMSNTSNCELPELSSNYDDRFLIVHNREPMGAISGTALHLAVQNQHLPNYCLESLLDAGALVGKLNLYGQNPLMGVMMDVYYDYHTNMRDHAHLLVSKMSLKELNAQDKRGWTAFHYAAQQGSKSCMELLMKAGCDCNLSSLKGETPLWILLVLGWEEGAKSLLMNGCNMDTPLNSTEILQMNQEVSLCRYGPISPIEFAVCNKYFAVAKLMIQLGCTIEQNSDLIYLSDIVKYKEFLNDARDFLCQKKQMQTLYSLCRTAVRNSFKQSINSKCQNLGLPPAVKDYVCFRDHY